MNKEKQTDIFMHGATLGQGVATNLNIQNLCTQSNEEEVDKKDELEKHYAAAERFVAASCPTDSFAVSTATDSLAVSTATTTSD